MNLPDEYERKNRYLKKYSNSARRYTPSLSNGRWMFWALIADAGWLVNAIFLITYYAMYGMHAELPAFLAVHILELTSVAAILIGYLCLMYASMIGEKAQLTKRQKNLGFGLPSIGSFSAVIFGIAQIVCAAVFEIDGSGYLALAAIGALLCFLGCASIFISFEPVRAKG